MSAHNARIMVVDDDIATGKLLIYQLRGLGYDVVHLHDGLQALQRVLIEQPDLILLDVMMPHVNGWDVCREIRACSSVPIIMVTGKDADDDVVTGLRAGADDYVTKPFNMAQLQARVEAVLRRAHARPGPLPASARAPSVPAPQSSRGVAERAPVQRVAAPQPEAVGQPIGQLAVASAQASAGPVGQPGLGGAGVISVLRPAPQPAQEAPAPPVAEPPMRLGQRLRQARQQRGLTLYQAERLCHVRWEILQSLEYEAFEAIPREQLRVALAAYANLLHVPLERYTQRKQPRTVQIEAHQVVALILTILLLLAAALLFL